MLGPSPGVPAVIAACTRLPIAVATIKAGASDPAYEFLKPQAPALITPPACGGRVNDALSANCRSNSAAMLCHTESAQMPDSRSPPLDATQLQVHDLGLHAAAPKAIQLVDTCVWPLLSWPGSEAEASRPFAGVMSPELAARRTLSATLWIIWSSAWREGPPSRSDPDRLSAAAPPPYDSASGCDGRAGAAGSVFQPATWTFGLQRRHLLRACQCRASLSRSAPVHLA